MPHSVFDERGEMLRQFESDLIAFAFCLQRQRDGKLTSMLMSHGAEVLFSPLLSAGSRAETALEFKARTAGSPNLLPLGPREKEHRWTNRRYLSWRVLAGLERARIAKLPAFETWPKQHCIQCGATLTTCLPSHLRARVFTPLGDKHHVLRAHMPECTGLPKWYEAPIGA